MKKLFIPIILLLLSFSGTPTGAPPFIINKSHPLAQGLVGFWALGEGGGTKAMDATLFNDGTLTNGAFYQQSTKGSCVSFDGTDDYIPCGNRTNTNVTSAFTLSYWFKRSSGQKQHVGKYQSSSGKCYLLQIFSDNKIYLVVSNDGTNDQYMVSTPSTTTTEWTFLTGVFNGGGAGNSTRIFLYLNGQPLAGTYGGTIPASTTITNSPFEIQRYNGITIPVYGQGLMNNISLYNRALSQNEIMELYKNPYCMFLKSKRFFN